MHAHTGHRGTGLGALLAGLLMHGIKEEMERGRVKGAGRCEEMRHANKPVCSSMNAPPGVSQLRECTGKAGTLAGRCATENRYIRTQRKGER